MLHTRHTHQSSPVSAKAGRRVPLLLPIAIALTLASASACAEGDISGVSGAPGRAFSVAVGHTLDLRLQNIGPGQYLDPPQISSSAVRFVKVSQVGPFVPAGITQVFRFQGVSPGRATISFHSSGTSAAIMDTIDVN